MTGPTYAVLRDILLRMGFEDVSTPGKNHLLEHSIPKTWVLMRPYKDDDIVAWYDVSNARDMLDYRGLMSPEDFAEALRERSLAG